MRMHMEMECSNEKWFLFNFTTIMSTSVLKALISKYSSSILYISLTPYHYYPLWGRETEHKQPNDTKKINKAQTTSSLSFFPSEMFAKLGRTLTAQQKMNIHKTHTNKGNNNKQWINNHRTTALERTSTKATKREVSWPDFENGHYQDCIVDIHCNSLSNFLRPKPLMKFTIIYRRNY